MRYSDRMTIAEAFELLDELDEAEADAEALDETAEEEYLEGLRFFDFSNNAIKANCDNSQSGIYLIVNSDTGQKYVGQAKHLRDRLQRHYYRCVSEKEPSVRDSPYLHNAIRKAIAEGDPGRFKVAILEYTANLDEAEKRWIDALDTYRDKRHYNLTAGGQGGVVTHSTPVVSYERQIDGDPDSDRAVSWYDSVVDAALDVWENGYTVSLRDPTGKKAGEYFVPSAAAKAKKADVETIRKKISDAINGARTAAYGKLWGFASEFNADGTRKPKKQPEADGLNSAADEE